MQRHGWTLLFHDHIVEQLQRLQAAAERTEKADRKATEHNANVKAFRALSRLILNVVPSDPSGGEYRQGNTVGPAYRHWRRAKFGGRFRLFFRYDSRTKVIVYAWVNDQRAACGRSQVRSVRRVSANARTRQPAGPLGGPRRGEPTEWSGIRKRS